jgi:hypothetical protein
LVSFQLFSSWASRYRVLSSLVLRGRGGGGGGGGGGCCWAATTAATVAGRVTVRRGRRLAPVVASSVRHGLDEHGLRLRQRHLACRLRQRSAPFIGALDGRGGTPPLSRCERQTSRCHPPCAQQRQQLPVQPRCSSARLMVLMPYPKPLLAMPSPLTTNA